MRVIIDYKCHSFPESIRLTGASKWLFWRVLKNKLTQMFLVIWSGGLLCSRGQQCRVTHITQKMSRVQSLWLCICTTVCKIISSVVSLFQDLPLQREDFVSRGPVFRNTNMGPEIQKGFKSRNCSDLGLRVWVWKEQLFQGRKITHYVLCIPW